MSSSFDDDSSECPYSQLLRELDETYSFVLDEKYQRSNSVLLETSRSDEVAVRITRRSSSCEPKPRTIRWNEGRPVSDSATLWPLPSPVSVSSCTSSQSVLRTSTRDETEEFHSPGKPFHRPRRNNAPKDDGANKSVESFKRSLRLLGLSPTDLGLINSAENGENCTTNTPKRRCCALRPRLSTRLTRKSISLDDVRKATPLMLSDVDAHRLVTNAVYEEWYFGKQTEILRKKREEAEEERRKAEKTALEKEELRRKSEEKFHEWLQKKLQQKKESQTKRARSTPCQRHSYESRHAVTPDQAAEAYLKWLQEKDRQKRQGKNGATTGNRSNSRRQLDPERREEALKVYQHWKKAVDANRRKELAEKQRKQEEEESEKRQKEQKKLEDARRCFQHWKSRKEQEIGQQQEKRRLAELREKQRQQEKKWHRSESASKAFLDWLDAVDERTLHATSLRRNCARSEVAF